MLVQPVDNGPIDIRALIHQGGSGSGVSYYLKRAECPKRILLNAQAEEEGDRSVSEPMAIGTIFHKLAELYHTGGDVNRVPHIVDDDPLLSSWCVEAWRLFDFYVTYTAPDAWGRVVAAEELVETMVPFEGLPIVGQQVPRPLSGRIDLLTEQDERFGNEYNGPGEYVLDFKTHKSKPSEVFMKDQYSLQFVNYAWQRFLKTGKWVRGAIVHHLVRHVKLEVQKSVLTTFIHPPMEHEIEKLKGFVHASAALPDGFANLSQCTPFTGVCRHLVSGRCNQLSERT